MCLQLQELKPDSSTGVADWPYVGCFCLIHHRPLVRRRIMATSTNSMAHTSPWTALEIQNQSDLPRLLIRSRLDATGYEVSLTDLSRVWCEQLTKKDIISRALDSGCPIDPSQDTQQYDILLDKVRDALNHEERTSLDLEATDDGSNSLVLTLSAPLPAPLSPLKWTVNLLPLPADSVDTELVTPLLHQAQNLQKQIQSLIREIQSRDRVISKITDRLETSGNDLTTVFPGMSHMKWSKTRSQRDQLARHVQGLADFDEGAWTAQHQGVDDGKPLTAGALNGIFQSMSALRKEPKPDELAREWWLGIARGASRRDNYGVDSDAAAQRLYLRASNEASHDLSQQQGDSVMEDDFQPQATPPNMEKDDLTTTEPLAPTVDTNGVRNRKETPTEDDSTEDEDDLDAPLTRTVDRKREQSHGSCTETSRAQASVSTPRKLGTVGGRSKQQTPDAPLSQTSQQTSQQTSPQKPYGKLGTLGGGLKKPPPAIEEPQMPKALEPVRASAKLGTLGGKAKLAGAPMPAELQHARSAEPSTPVIRQAKLGLFRGKEKTKSSTSNPEPARDEAAMHARETSVERADRKRDQLKQQLEEKAKQPVKKKRKF